jgi:dUTP pyrophosphatase
VLEKKEINLLSNSLVCEIHIEKSSTAKKLEEQFNIDWSFEVYNHLEPFYHLRACVEEEITIEPQQIVPIPTGIYPQLLSPNFTIEVSSLSGLIYNYGVVMPEGVTYFPYTFRDEIWIFLENKNSEAVIIQPTQKIAHFTVKQLPRMVIKYVESIEESPWKMNSGKSFIRQIKDKLRKRTKVKGSKNYERNEIKNIIGDINES